MGLCVLLMELHYFDEDGAVCKADFQISLNALLINLILSRSLKLGSFRFLLNLDTHISKT